MCVGILYTHMDIISSFSVITVSRNSLEPLRHVSVTVNLMEGSMEF